MRPCFHTFSLPPSHRPYSLVSYPNSNPFRDVSSHFLRYLPPPIATLAPLYPNPPPSPFAYGADFFHLILFCPAEPLPEDHDSLLPSCASGPPPLFPSGISPSVFPSPDSMFSSADTPQSPLPSFRPSRCGDFFFSGHTRYPFPERSCVLPLYLVSHSSYANYSALDLSRPVRHALRAAFSSRFASPHRNRFPPPPLAFRVPCPRPSFPPNPSPFSDPRPQNSFDAALFADRLSVLPCVHLLA